MCTESGAIYVTNNTAYTWKAAVQETVDATLNRTVSSGISGASYYEGSFANIVRSASGSYIGVSSRGNFYMTWSPGDSSWEPHNRPSKRRLQNLGWTNDERIWVTTRGGDVLFSDDDGVAAERFGNAKIGSRGFGLLDIGYDFDSFCNSMCRNVVFCKCLRSVNLGCVSLMQVIMLLVLHWSAVHAHSACRSARMLLHASPWSHKPF